MGLVGHFEGKKLDIPLISIQASLVSHDTSGIVTVTQKYVNPCKQRIEAFYAFPLYEDATVIACNVEFKNGKITCVVKEKNLAEKEYRDATESGQQAALMREISGEHYDVSVGNMDPLEEVSVIIKYLTTLKWDLERKSYRFTFPTTITPRYDNRIDFTNAFGQSYDNRNNFNRGYLMEVLDLKDPKEIFYSEMAKNVTLDISVECTLNDLLKSIEPVDSFNGQYLEKNISDNKGMIRLGNIKMDKDFIINIVPVDSSPRDYIMQEEYSDGSFTWKIQADAKKIVKQDANKRFEFIFVVDQSGSMAGPQIEHARQALNILVNSLQQGSIFNVYGFGSSFYSFFQKSADYNEANFNAAKRFIRKKVHDNLGGTEINAPFHHIYGLKKSFGFERRIILLTDGEVQNMQELFDICRQDSETRVYTIGIGNGVSHLLVEGLAKNTGGNCVIVTENELIEEKCMYQLKFAMSEPVEAQIEDEKIQIIPGSMFVDHRIVQKGITGEHVQVSLAGPDEPDLILKVINCSKSDPSPLRLHSIKESITELTKEHEMLKISSEKNDIYKKIVDLSTKYNVLCPYTAFVGILEGPRGDTSTRTLVSPLSAGKYASPTALGWLPNTNPVSYAQIRLKSSTRVFNFGNVQAQLPTSAFPPSFPSSYLSSNFGVPFSAKSSSIHPYSYTSPSSSDFPPSFPSSNSSSLFSAPSPSTPHAGPPPSFGSPSPSSNPFGSPSSHSGPSPSFGSSGLQSFSPSPSPYYTTPHVGPPPFSAAAATLFGHTSAPTHLCSTFPSSLGSSLGSPASDIASAPSSSGTTSYTSGFNFSSQSVGAPSFLPHSLMAMDCSSTSLPPFDSEDEGGYEDGNKTVSSATFHFGERPTASPSHFANRTSLPFAPGCVLAKAVNKYENNGSDACNKRVPIDKSFMDTLLILCQNFDGSFQNFFPPVLAAHFINKSNVPDVIWYTVIAQMMIRRVNNIQDSDEIPIKWRIMYEKAEAYITKNGDPIEVVKAIEATKDLFDECVFV